jgi:glycine cleavage system H lipoate-binding protein
MFTHDPYMVKAVEYLVGIGSLLLFVVFWRFVNGEAAPVAVPAWANQIAEWFKVPEGMLFHPGHAWAREESPGLLTIGLDDFAQQLVGPVAAVDLPAPGTRLHAGTKGWTLRSGDRGVDMLAPVTGTVVAVNTDVKDRAGLVNRDPYGQGWLMKVQVPRASASFKDLVTGAAARRWIDKVAQELTATMTPELGHVYQDGGVPVQGLARSIDDAHWDALARRFLLS